MPKINKIVKNYKTVDILNVKVDFINISKALSEIENWVKTNKKYQIVTPNPEQVMLAEKDYRFKKILNNASLRIPDGVGLVWAAKWLHGASLRSGDRNLFGFRIARRIKSKSSILSLALANIRKHSQICLPSREVKKGNFCQSPRAHNLFQFHRLAGIDLMLAMCKLAAQKRWRVFLLGGKNDVAKKAAEQLAISNQQLAISNFGGTCNITNESQGEREETIKKINQFRPHFLFVAYGAPEQEKWIDDNLPKLDIKVAMGVGGAFDYLADMMQRAPFCIRSLGFEWFWRLLHQPSRIRRQLALLKFVWLVLKNSRITSKKP